MEESNQITTGKNQHQSRSISTLMFFKFRHFITQRTFGDVYMYQGSPICTVYNSVETDFYTKLKKLDIQEGKKDKLFADHVTQVCKAHNRVIVSFIQQVQGGTRPTTEGSRENIGHNVHDGDDCFYYYKK